MLEKIFLNLKIYVISIISFLSFLIYFFVRKSSKLEEKNESLNEKIKDFSDDAEKIIEAQSKQIEIASNHIPDRERFYEWVRTKGKKPNV